MRVDEDGAARAPPPRCRRSRISRRPTGSTPSVGSSRSRTSGSWTSAAARPSRCVMPLENFLTRTSAHSESRTRSSSSGIAPAQRRRGRCPTSGRRSTASAAPSGSRGSGAPPAGTRRGGGSRDRATGIPKSRGLARGRVRQAEEDLDGRRLAGAVRAQKAEELARPRPPDRCPSRAATLQPPNRDRYALRRPTASMGCAAIAYAN